jgi:hypothetical protein
MLWLVIYTYSLCHIKWLFFKVSFLLCFILLILPEKFNINLSKFAELHASLLANNMNVVKYVKQLQCHLADVQYGKKSSSEQWIVGVYKLSFYFIYGLCSDVMSISHNNHQIVGWVVNDELKGRWKEGAVAWFEVQSEYAA